MRSSSRALRVFAGVGDNAYFRRNLWGNPAVKAYGEFRLRLANEKDYVATPHRVCNRTSRPRGKRADCLLDVPRRRQPGHAKPSRGRKRRRALRRRIRRGAAEQRARVQRGQRVQPRRPLPPL